MGQLNHRRKAKNSLVPPFPPLGIGANDVANSFASSVGAKALTMPQALLVAAVCEFSGAVLLGSGVTDTIKGGIAKPATFASTPDLFLYGFFCVMIAAGFWDNFACHLHLPVSGGRRGRQGWGRESSAEPACTNIN